MKVFRIEDAEEVDVGRFYEVPAVREEYAARRLKRLHYWPIIGPSHDDRELTGLDAEHWRTNGEDVRANKLSVSSSPKSFPAR